MDVVLFGPWSGAVTSTTARVVAAARSDRLIALRFSSRRTSTGELAEPRQASEISSLVTFGYAIVTFELTGLAADTVYHYELELDGAAMPGFAGRLKTFPPEGQPASFSLVCAGDADTGSNHKVFDAIRQENALLFVHLGDLHYEDINDNKGAKYIAAYTRALNLQRQKELYRNCPIAYTWDDHDYSHNNAESDAIGRIVARQMYHACVPHYPFAEPGSDRAIYQAFTIGRVRFLLSDCRSERSKKAKTLLGATQKEWLKAEMLRARDLYPLTVWVNTIPWIAAKGEKSWDLWSKERQEIAEFIVQNGIDNVCMLSADAHMLAIDDGRNNRLPNGGGDFPIFHASPLDRSGSIKGGPYSHGPVKANGGQYGVMHVRDDGGPKVTVHWEGKRVGNGVLMEHRFTSPRG